MGKVSQVLLVLMFCFASAKSIARMHSAEEMTKAAKTETNIQKSLNSFSKNLSSEAAAKYKILRKALEAYATASSEKEANAPGTGWADAVMGSRWGILKNFIELHKKMESQELQVQSDVDAKAKDDELNGVYQKIQKNEDLDSGVAAATSRQNIKDTQRIWIKYRDAWLGYAKIRFPSVSAASLNAFLTAKRTSDIKEFAAEEGRP